MQRYSLPCRDLQVLTEGIGRHGLVDEGWKRGLSDSMVLGVAGFPRHEGSQDVGPLVLGRLAAGFHPRTSAARTRATIPGRSRRAGMAGSRPARIWRSSSAIR